MEKRYSDSMFKYEYNGIYEMHVVSIYPVELLDNEDFKEDICVLYDEFETKFASEIMVVSSEDVSIHVNNPIYQTVLNCKEILRTEKPIKLSSRTIVERSTSFVQLFDKIFDLDGDSMSVQGNNSLKPTLF